MEESFDVLLEDWSVRILNAISFGYEASNEELDLVRYMALNAGSSVVVSSLMEVLILLDRDEFHRIAEDVVKICEDTDIRFEVSLKLFDMGYKKYGSIILSDALDVSSRLEACYMVLLRKRDLQMSSDEYQEMVTVVEDEMARLRSSAESGTLEDGLILFEYYIRNEFPYIDADVDYYGQLVPESFSPVLEQRIRSAQEWFRKNLK